MIYQCDRCSKKHLLNESKIKNKQSYVPPSGCYEGDYYTDEYYWFQCDCGRAIKVKEEHLLNPHSIEKEYSAHIGVSSLEPYENIAKKIVILYSGGLDSFLMYEWAKINCPGDEIVCVYYDYGNPVCKNEIAVLPSFVKVKQIQWFEGTQDSLKSKAKETNKAAIYIPGRNLVFSVLAACQELPDEIFLGGLLEEFHDDATDKNQKFIDYTNATLQYVLSPFKQSVKIRFPYVENKITKFKLIKWAIDNEISEKDIVNTVSCYKGFDEKNEKIKGCGECHACIKNYGYFYYFNLRPKFKVDPFFESNYGEKYIIDTIANLEKIKYKNIALLNDLCFEGYYKLIMDNHFPWVTENILRRLEIIINEKNNYCL